MPLDRLPLSRQQQTPFFSDGHCLLATLEAFTSMALLHQLLQLTVVAQSLVRTVLYTASGKKEATATSILGITLTNLNTVS